MKNELPDGWEWKKLGEICDFVRGPFGGSLKKSCFKPEGIAVYEQQHAIYNQFKEIRYFIDEEKFNEMKRFEIAPGDLLMSCSGTMGKVAIVPEGIQKGIINQALLKLSPHKDLYSKFLKFWMESTNFQEQIAKHSQGAAIQNVASVNILKGIKVLLPTFPEQQCIVSILEKAEKTKKLRAQADELTQQLLQSVFLEMFGDPLINPKWNTSNLEDLCTTITDGEHSTPKRVETGFYLLSARNIQNHKLALNDVDFIDQEEYDRISKRIIPTKNDVLISCSGTIGRVTRVKEDFKFQLVRSVALLRPETTKIHPVYLEYSLDTHFIKSQIEKSVNQSSQANLFQGKIKKLKVTVPPLQLQCAFASTVEKFEEMVSKQNKSKQELDNLFNTLMQKAFNGELVHETRT